MKDERRKTKTCKQIVKDCQLIYLNYKIVQKLINEELSKLFFQFENFFNFIQYRKIASNRGLSK